ncbi:TOMM system kinase/cyclase fusion protein [Pseudoalteromonas luteoviolacea]|uniref:TOMM system kinase/cyclase fusion protein n=1 Tax=Pseudoalteromonas luteoviolacea TaxID=43657 RepID=UPI001B39BA5F|nr:TOMM system kinase/cyclase fusion protein [Pseudoalteromonas luteoviolacea]MBQ4811373.1 TOMM system kinase/cyclase fusion protein [Pseudoalteromonas luteoviolacea]
MSLTHFSDPYIENRFDSAQYELLYKIGEGGFGKVFKARNKNTDQTVAIKFLALEPHLEEAKKKRYIERFKRETALSGQLEHPHIVRLLDKGQVDEHLLFGVFEYIEGQSLREYLMQEGALDAVNATDIMLQVLDALIHAHKKGIIHRDIKPANIMLTQAGAKTHAKILDFGIGTLTQENRHQDFSTITLTQETIGTPSYSAPEQLRGEPASEKTDLYVWGLVLLECLTGMPAVTGSSVASIYHKQLSDVHIPIPSALLGHPLSGLLRRVLQKNATERVISGQEIYSELNLMNVSNLVGILADVQAQHGYDDNTVVLRNDDPNSPLAHDYTTLTERKQITVLALRLSAKRLNDSAKDLDIIDTLFKSQRNHCIDIATRFGAYHVGNLADTMLFYFGYPVASDNDTRLCARTALEAISELSKRNALMQEAHGIQLNAHAGINSGIFVTYANAVPEGNVANTAMELARLAGERQILCSAESRSILEPYSDFDYFDNIQIGLSFEQLTLYNLKGEKRIEAFGFMRGTKTNHKLIGRQLELDKTLSVINGENNTRIAHIYGEAGIGKSRLLQEVRDNASKYQHLVAQCLPEHQNNALYPILNLIRYLFNTDNVPATDIALLFKDFLEEHGLSEENIEATIPVLMAWLAIPLPDEAQTSSHSPDEQKALLFTGLSALLLSRKSSITEFKLYIIEDIHWSDAVTLEFLRHFAGQLQDGSVMISTSRQSCPSSLHDLTLLEVELNKLTNKATTDFIEQLFECKHVSENVRSVLVKRTDGIPLFIEELVGMLKDKRLVHETNGSITFISPDRLEQVPSSLRESLQQKLDNLVHAKETAQLAATIGREFSYTLLVEASTLSEDQIQNDLNELLEKELIIQQRRVETDSYIFKHALVRDAAYDSQTQSEAMAKHELFLGALERLDLYKEQPFITAFHLQKVKKFEKAANLMIESSNSAKQLYAIIEAESFLQEALRICLTGELSDSALYIKVKNDLASIRIAGNGWVDEQANHALQENYKVLSEDTDAKERFTTTRGLWLQLYATGKTEEAHEIALDLYHNGTWVPNEFKPVIYEIIIQTLFSKAEFSEILRILDEIPDNFFRNDSETISNNFGFCSELVCIGFRAFAELHLSNQQSADTLIEIQTQLADQIGIIDVLAATNGFQAEYHLNKALLCEQKAEFLDYIRAAQFSAQTGIDLAKEAKNEGWQGYCEMLHFIASVNVDTTVEQFEEGIKQFSGYLSHRAFYYSVLAKMTYLLHGEVNTQFLDIAEESCEISSSFYVKPQLNTLRKI